MCNACGCGRDVELNDLRAIVQAARLTNMQVRQLLRELNGGIAGSTSEDENAEGPVRWVR